MKILFLDIDTLRPDHMSCYGYPRRTTPNLDAVAREGLRFTNYYCSDAPCLPSRAALVSGQFGIRNGVTGHGGTAADRRLEGAPRGFRDSRDTMSFHNIFRRAGMYTASVSTFPERHSAWWFNAGFNETFNQGSGGRESGELVLPYALKWLDDNGLQRENWFLHVHLWDPHTPYRAPESFGNPFRGDGLAAQWIDDGTLRRHLKKVGPHSASELNMFDDRENPLFPRSLGRITDRESLEAVFDGYDCGIAYMDSLVGKILDKLKELGIYGETAILLTSDHGENMGELGIYSEHATADQPCCRIPMLIRWPGGVRGAVDEGLHYSLDLLPTMCDLLQVAPGNDWDGRSFAGTITKGAREGRESLVLSQMAHVCQRSARFDRWLYIRSYHDGYHLFDKEMLFDLEADPYEQHDVKEQYPEVCARGAKIILDWTDEAMARVPDGIDPLWTVQLEGGPFHARGHLADYCRRLEETGRAEGAAELRRRHPSEL